MSRRGFSNITGQADTKRTRSQNKLKAHRFIGVDLSGGKNDRTSVAVLEYYPQQSKLFLTQIFEKVQQEGDISADQVLYEIISESQNNLEFLCLNAPLKFPKCVRCRLVCPGYERCKEKEIAWMWRQHKKIRKAKPRSKLFTPYTQRAAEMYVASEIGESVTPQEALGANIAPLAARTHFLLRRLPKVNAIEVFPKLSVLRIGQNLKMNRSHLLFYNHQVDGEESRQTFLQNLVKRDLVFIYQQDFLKLIDNLDSFDAFICAFTGFLKFKDQCEKPPKDFPLEDGWIEFPIKNADLIY